MSVERPTRTESIFVQSNVLPPLPSVSFSIIPFIVSRSFRTVSAGNFCFFLTALVCLSQTLLSLNVINCRESRYWISIRRTIREGKVYLVRADETCAPRKIRICESRMYLHEKSDKNMSSMRFMYLICISISFCLLERIKIIIAIISDIKIILNFSNMLFRFNKSSHFKCSI